MWSLADLTWIWIAILSIFRSQINLIYYWNDFVISKLTRYYNVWTIMLKYIVVFIFFHHSFDGFLFMAWYRQCDSDLSSALKSLHSTYNMNPLGSLSIFFLSWGCCSGTSPETFSLRPHVFVALIRYRTTIEHHLCFRKDFIP